MSRIESLAKSLGINIKYGYLLKHGMIFSLDRPDYSEYVYYYPEHDKIVIFKKIDNITCELHTEDEVLEGNNEAIIDGIMEGRIIFLHCIEPEEMDVMEELNISMKDAFSNATT